MADPASITYMGQPASVNCDRNCAKAWGIADRPRVMLSDDVDDYELLADEELGEAPADPGTYEGGYGKPDSPNEFPNKWCVRACERCVISEPGKWALPLVLPDFTKRRRNKLETHP